MTSQQYIKQRNMKKRQEEQRMRVFTSIPLFSLGYVR